ncbi:uncharacterized protein LOC116733250 [Xiphophorus hellerii]|uniref:uncharacterized protein LOC116733250 n=1 Tax=Xiphophorus hellerii TaxID=8084 RepID=UPI0013B3EB89|nr:uncharacterized protein LOC116733250 [Xiphophorus hellerii]
MQVSDSGGLGSFFLFVFLFPSSWCESVASLGPTRWSQRLSTWEARPWLLRTWRSSSHHPLEVKEAHCQHFDAGVFYLLGTLSPSKLVLRFFPLSNSSLSSVLFRNRLLLETIWILQSDFHPGFLVKALLVTPWTVPTGCPSPVFTSPVRSQDSQLSSAGSRTSPPPPSNHRLPARPPPQPSCLGSRSFMEAGSVDFSLEPTDYLPDCDHSFPNSTPGSSPYHITLLQ